MTLDVIRQIRALLAGIHALALHEAKSGSDKGVAATLKQVVDRTPIIEREINQIVLACTRARPNILENRGVLGQSFH